MSKSVSAIDNISTADILLSAFLHLKNKGSGTFLNRGNLLQLRPTDELLTNAFTLAVSGQRLNRSQLNLVHLSNTEQRQIGK